MKWTLLGSVFMACLVVAYGYFYCEEALECEADECCVVSSVGQLRRKGLCRKRGRTGSPCNEEGAKYEYYGDKYLFKCPCRADLYCMPTGIFAGGDGTRAQVEGSQKCVRLQFSDAGFSDLNADTNGTAIIISDDNNSGESEDV